MKKHVAPAVGLLVAGLLAACGPKTARTDGLETTSVMGGFSVMAPITLIDSSQSVDTQYGKLWVHTFTGSSGGVDYNVGYAEYPPGLLAQSTAEQMYDGNRSALVNNSSGRLLLENTITLSGYPAREVTVEAKGRAGEDVMIRARFILAKTRMYQVMVIAPKTDAGADAANKFLASLKLL